MAANRLKALLVAGLLPLLLARPWVATAATPVTPAYTEALERFAAFGIARGLRDKPPEAPVTRAELARLLVEAAGQREAAELAAGARPYPDTGGHPDAGYILIARNLGLLAAPAGSPFYPDQPVTWGETLAMLDRLVAMPPEAAALLLPAVGGPMGGPMAGPGQGASALSDRPMTWSEAAVLADQAFGHWPGEDGRTLYQRNFDSEAPVLQLGSLPAQTDAATVTLTGSATGARSVAVGGQEVARGSGQVLRFRAEIPLQMGSNLIRVTARDDAGNVATLERTVERTPPPPARLEGPSELRLQAGESVTLQIAAFDAEGRPVARPTYSARVTGGVGQYDTTTHRFTASRSPGRGTIQLRAGTATLTINVTVDPAPITRVEVTVTPAEAAPLTVMRVQARAIDALGRVVSSAKPVWEFSAPEAVFDPVQGEVMASRPGRFPIRATVDGVTGEATVAVWGEVAGLVLEGPAEVLGNERELAPFTVTAIDRFGTRVGSARNRILLEGGGGETVNRSGRPISYLNLVGGRGTFYLRAGAAVWNESIEVRVTDEADPAIQATAPLAVRPQEPVAVQVTPALAYLPNNDPDQANPVTLAVVDTQGAPLLDGEWEISWDLTGPARVTGTRQTSGTVAYLGGQDPPALALAAEPGTVGEVTVTASAPGLLAGSGTIGVRAATSKDRITLSISPIRGVVTENPERGVAVTVQVTDPYGNPAPYTGPVYLDVAGPFTAAGGLAAADDLADTDGDGNPDRVKLDFAGEESRTIRMAATRAGSTALSAYFPSIRPVPARASVTWLADPSPDQLAVRFADPRDGAVVPLEEPTGTLEVQVTDRFGNAVIRPGVEVTLRGMEGTAPSAEMTLNGTTGPVTVTTNTRGRAAVRVAIPPEAGRQFQVQILDAYLGEREVQVLPDGSSFSITASPAVPDRLELSLLTPEGHRLTSVRAGEPVVLQAVVQNRSGQPLAQAGHLLRLRLPDATWSRDPAPENSYGTPEPAAGLESGGWIHLGDTDPAQTGTYQRTLYPARAGRLQVIAGVDTWQRRVEAGATLLVTPGPAAGLVLREAGEGLAESGAGPVGTGAEAAASNAVLQLPEAEWVAVTLAVSDLWGNPTAGTGEYQIGVTVTGGIQVRPAGQDRELTEGWTAYLTDELALEVMLPGGGLSGTLTFTEAGGRLLPRTYGVEGIIQAD